jgi:RNase H-fold protein (predicted Holliday junction resolvase)
MRVVGVDVGTRRIGLAVSDLSGTLSRPLGRRLAEACGLAVHFQDERLSSHEADAMLAVREKDWRVRKRQLDAMSAAVILQDYLDAHTVARAIDEDPA